MGIVERIFFAPLFFVNGTYYLVFFVVFLLPLVFLFLRAIGKIRMLGTLLVSLAFIAISFFIPVISEKRDCGPHNNYCCCDQVTGRVIYGYPFVLKGNIYGGVTGGEIISEKMSIVYNVAFYFIFLNSVIALFNLFKRFIYNSVARKNNL